MKNLEQFLNDLRENEELRMRMAAVGNEAEVNAILAEEGYETSAADLKAYIEEFQKTQTELSDDELDAAAGGADNAVEYVVSALGSAVAGAGAGCWV